MAPSLHTALLLSLLFATLVLPARSQDGGGAPAIVPLAARGALKIGNLRVNSDEIGLYEKLEITFDLSGAWDNPFDPAQVDVNAEFHAPDGKQRTIPGFFHQEYRLDNDGRHVTVGVPVWKVRFTPVMVGRYSYRVIVRNKGERLVTPLGHFSSVSYRANHGFLRISPTNPLYFELDDGTPFFGIAMGRCCGDYAEMERRYRRFSPVGGNFNRLFLTNGPYDIGELHDAPERADRGLGKLNLESSWNLDKLLALGEELGIYHILTLTNQWTFNHRWETHVFNKTNGGILNDPAAYWTSEDAMRHLEQRLRYIVARWGYSTSVFSWDLWNEYSAMPGGSDLSLSIPWHQRMARYLASLDAFDHVIHTNDGSLNGRDQMHALPEMELVSTNSYMVKNIANVAEVWTKRHTRQFRKPYVLSEFGTGHAVGDVGGYAGMDPERRMVHDGLWSPLMSGSASTGLAWEGNWLDHEIFYTYIRAVSRFVDGIPFGKREWAPVEVTSFRFDERSASKPAYADVIVEGWSGNFRRSSSSVSDVFTIDRDGRVDHQESLNAELTGSPDERETASVTFDVEYPVDGQFAVYITEVRRVEPTPRLTVTLDAEEVLAEDVLPATGADYHPIMHNRSYAIPISSGTHRIRVANSGGGSFVTAFELENYVRRDSAHLEVRGLQCDDYVLLWLKNQQFTLLHELMGAELTPQPPGTLTLQDVPTGRWLAEWIDTLDGASIKTELVESGDHQLALSTPTVEKSVAVRLRRI